MGLARSFKIISFSLTEQTYPCPIDHPAGLDGETTLVQVHILLEKNRRKEVVRWVERRSLCACWCSWRGRPQQVSASMLELCVYELQVLVCNAARCKSLSEGFVLASSPA